MSDGYSLDQRLEFLGLEKGAPALRHVSDAIDKTIRPALTIFYDKIKDTPEVRRFFSDDAHIERAKSAQQAHWSVIASGGYDVGYVDRVRRIGQAHARIGLEPRWYIGGYGLILEQLLTAVIQASWPKGLGVQRDGGAKLARAASSPG